ITIFAIAICDQSVFAQEQPFTLEQQTLINQHNRPTIAQVLKAFPLTAARTNPFAPFVASGPTRPLDPPRGRYGNFDVHTIARAVVNLEVGFPGARYMYLGRDSALNGDVVDAFYTLVNDQPGRVGRLNASGASLGNRRPENFPAYLKRSEEHT